MDEVFEGFFTIKWKWEQEEKYTMNFKGNWGKFLDNYQVHEH